MGRQPSVCPGQVEQAMEASQLVTLLYGSASVPVLTSLSDALGSVSQANPFLLKLVFKTVFYHRNRNLIMTPANRLLYYLQELQYCLLLNQP